MHRHLILSSALAVSVLGLAACSGNSAGIPTTAAPAGVASHFVLPDAAAKNVILNPEFSNGKLAPWVAVGKTGKGSVSTKEHYGATKYSAFMGTTAPPAVDAVTGISQKVKVPTKGELTWWYLAASTDTPQYASDIVSVTEGTTTTTVWKSPSLKTSKWTEGKVSLAKYAGKTVTLTIAVDDNGYSKTYINEFIDDVSLVAGK